TVTVRRRIGGTAIELEGPTAGSCEADAVRYVLRDHLGGVDRLTDAQGTEAQAMSFAAWGARRDPGDWTELADAAARTFDDCATTRGFTGHEMLDAVGAVHMNGRLYDPHLGRFLRADPFVQFPANLQSHNRYSYALNNPLAYTDPSGYFLKGLLRPLASIAISVWLPGAGIWTGTGLFAANGIGAVAASGFIAGAVGSGTLKGAVFGAFNAAALNGLGGVPFGGDLGGVAVRSATYGFVGGVMGVLQSGRFGHGFLSAFATQAAAGRIGALEYERLRVAAAAALGGTVSAATGGKFANGAATAAFARSVAERQARWRASQTPYFRARVNISTQIMVPPLNASVSVAAAARAASLNYVGPPRAVRVRGPVPQASKASMDASATHGTDATFHRRGDMRPSGGINRAELLEFHSLALEPTFFALSMAVGGPAPRLVAEPLARLTAGLSKHLAQKPVRRATFHLLKFLLDSGGFYNDYISDNPVNLPPAHYRPASDTSRRSRALPVQELMDQ
ncbi:MAG: RHS repeat-associated core domain-containing protein, partial [Gammaproteobacteria bacterium]|nr:RHS repeat-associated core domain-containing protein [Gammaproteobacteria bacterium]